MALSSTWAAVLTVGIFEEGSPLSNHGFRSDVLDLLRALKLGVLRWPGGNFVSNYLWTDGIGPRPSRPRRVELAWGAVEPNNFGTDEFLQYCAQLGVAPYICLNMGTGTLSEALAWVEYCNSAARATGPTVAEKTEEMSPTACPTGAWAMRCTGSGRLGSFRLTST